jgi:hypothetical protein
MVVWHFCQPCTLGKYELHLLVLEVVSKVNLEGQFGGKLHNVSTWVIVLDGIKTIPAGGWIAPQSQNTGCNTANQSTIKILVLLILPGFVQCNIYGYMIRSLDMHT